MIYNWNIYTVYIYILKYIEILLCLLCLDVKCDRIRRTGTNLQERSCSPAHFVALRWSSCFNGRISLISSRKTHCRPQHLQGESTSVRLPTFLKHSKIKLIHSYWIIFNPYAILAMFNMLNSWITVVIIPFVQLFLFCSCLGAGSSQSCTLRSFLAARAEAWRMNLMEVWSRLKIIEDWSSQTWELSLNPKKSGVTLRRFDMVSELWQRVVRKKVIPDSEDKLRRCRCSKESWVFNAGSLVPINYIVIKQITSNYSQFQFLFSICFVNSVVVSWWQRKPRLQVFSMTGSFVLFSTIHGIGAGHLEPTRPSHVMSPDLGRRLKQVETESRNVCDSLKCLLTCLWNSFWTLTCDTMWHVTHVFFITDITGLWRPKRTPVEVLRLHGRATWRHKVVQKLCVGCAW